MVGFLQADLQEEDKCYLALTIAEGKYEITKGRYIETLPEDDPVWETLKKRKSFLKPGRAVAESLYNSLTRQRLVNWISIGGEPNLPFYYILSRQEYLSFLEREVNKEHLRQEITRFSQNVASLSSLIGHYQNQQHPLYYANLKYLEAGTSISLAVSLGIVAYNNILGKNNGRTKIKDKSTAEEND